MKKNLTKQTALSIFKSELPNYPRLVTDKPALREAWNNYTDALCKDSRITSRQYETWQNPF